MCVMPGSYRLPFALLMLVLLVLGWSAYKPHDYPTWVLEVAPAVIGIVILLATGRRFPMTPLSYVLIAAHCVLLIVGGHYTYSEVPIGNCRCQRLSRPCGGVELFACQHLRAFQHGHGAGGGRAIKGQNQHASFPSLHRRKTLR